MSEDIQKLLDETGWKILSALQHNARVSFSELARVVGLSAPAVTERVRRMEDAGIIAGYHAKISLDKLGLGLVAFVRLSSPAEKHVLMVQLAEGFKEVQECHRVTGSDNWILKVAVRDVQHLEEVLDQLLQYGVPTTSIVLSTPISERSISQG